jgi:hypothetical protein
VLAGRQIRRGRVEMIRNVIRKASVVVIAV